MREDPKGYYRILNLSPSATDEDIKKAYRNLAKKLHPDINSELNTNSIFQMVTEAYSVLSDPVQRSRYSGPVYGSQKKDYPKSDTTNQKPKNNQSSSFLEPYRCSDCSCISHKLRHVKYNQVVSFVFFCSSNTIWGIFCEECASRRIRKATLVTTAFGWMSAPGIFRTAFALGRNLTGGRQEKLINMEICARQALYHQQIGDIDKARSAAFDGIEFANSIDFHSDEKSRADDVKSILESVLNPKKKRQENFI